MPWALGVVVLCHTLLSPSLRGETTSASLRARRSCRRGRRTTRFNRELNVDSAARADRESSPFVCMEMIQGAHRSGRRGLGSPVLEKRSIARPGLFPRGSRDSLVLDPGLPVWRIREGSVSLHAPREKRDGDGARADHGWTARKATPLARDGRRGLHRLESGPAAARGRPGGGGPGQLRHGQAGQPRRGAVGRRARAMGALPLRRGGRGISGRLPRRRERRRRSSSIRPPSARFHARSRSRSGRTRQTRPATSPCSRRRGARACGASSTPPAAPSTGTARRCRRSRATSAALSPRTR